jgi:hypothetical protein
MEGAMPNDESAHKWMPPSTRSLPISNTASMNGRRSEKRLILSSLWPHSNRPHLPQICRVTATLAGSEVDEIDCIGDKIASANLVEPDGNSIAIV